ncbi:hypothetical protein LCGC14_3065460, partial [marine sediment metagenome]
PEGKVSNRLDSAFLHKINRTNYLFTVDAFIYTAQDILAGRLNTKRYHLAPSLLHPL